VVSQTGAVPPQFALDVQGTHVPVATLQAGVAPPHWLVFVSEHWPHAPLTWQAGALAGHSASAPHVRQVCVVPSHTGVAPLHWALDVHATHRPAETLHTGVAPTQRVEFSAEHWPHAPLTWQAGVVPPHSASPLQPRHVWNAGSQIGVAPEQSASAVHATQVPIVV
jgi:hypothetical protein